MSHTFYIWHTHPFGQDLSMHANISIPSTLTLTSESAFRFQILCLGFKNLIIAPTPIEVQPLCLPSDALGQDLLMCANILTPLTLTVTSVFI